MLQWPPPTNSRRKVKFVSKIPMMKNALTTRPKINHWKEEDEYPISRNKSRNRSRSRSRNTSKEGIIEVRKPESDIHISIGTRT